jgi:hypothetical protein
MFGVGLLIGVSGLFVRSYALVVSGPAVDIGTPGEGARRPTLLILLCKNSCQPSYP